LLPSFSLGFVSVSFRFISLLFVCAERFGVPEILIMKILIVIALCCVALLEARNLQKRNTADLSDTIDQIKSKFPKEEWDNFWQKLSQALGDQREAFQKKLEENKGNMGLTLMEFRDKMHDKYPAVTQMWERVKTKWDELTAKMDSTTLADVWNYAKERIQKMAEGLQYENVYQWWDSAKAYAVTFFANVGEKVHTK